MEIIKSGLFKDMWECRNEDGWLIGCGSNIDEAILDSKCYDDSIDVETWISPNMKDKLPTWPFK